MKSRYLFSSSDGDVSLDEKTLDRAFLLNPFDPHPFLTLRDYFQTIERFILDRLGILLEKNAAGLRFDQTGEILIRSEKHGTLSHVVSVELLYGGDRKKFAISVAFSKPLINALLREFSTVEFLNGNFPYPYLPKGYLAEKVPCSNPKGTEIIGLCVSDWLEGYHEWHLTADRDEHQAVLIWDTDKGNRRVSEKGSRSIFREAAKILTLYYDPTTYRQIYPWHHAAGDFVVKADGGLGRVKLTTARDYISLISFPKKAAPDRMTALFAFLLNMTIQIRLDKLGGVGDPVWAHTKFLQPCLEGFFAALQRMRAEGRWNPAPGPDPLILLKEFSKKEIETLYSPLMASYRIENPADFKIVESHLEAHIAALWTALRKGSLASWTHHRKRR